MKCNQSTRALLAAVLMASALYSASSSAQITFNISLAPPSPVYEAVPVVPQGYVWAPGYWAWNNDHHVWIHGRPIVQRVGYRWVPDNWERRDQRYYRQPGRWERDAGYKAVKIKKEKKSDKHDSRHDDDDQGHRGKSDKHGKGGKHD